MFNNYFKENSKTIKRVSLALKTFIGGISVSAYLGDQPKVAFWLLVFGAVLDFLLQCFPSDDDQDHNSAGGYNPNQNHIASPAGIALLIGLALFSLSGCKIIKPAVRTTIRDSVSVNYRTVNIDVPGAKVQSGINADSLIKAFIDAQKNGKPLPAPQTYTDPKSKAELKVWIDQYGNLQASCESKDQTIQSLIAELTKTREINREKDNIVYKTPTMNYIAMSILGTLLAISFIVNFITIKRK